MMRNIIVILLCPLIFPVNATNFTIINGQIFTPGLAIVDAPQPNTPLGGDSLQVALDISGDGKLQLPPYPANAPTAIYNITIFLSSYVTGLNLTITNGTAGSGNASLGDILTQEPGSTVKHVNWIWPSCLVGNGPPTDSTSSRGDYNITIQQSFAYNSTSYYTLFDLPISVTNSIPSPDRPSCDVLTNPLLSQAALAASADTIPPGEYPWVDGNGAQTAVPGAGTGTTSGIGSASSSSAVGSGSGGSGGATSTETGTGGGSSMATGTGSSGSGSGSSSSSSSSSAASSTPYFGDPKPDATPQDGLGAGAVLRPVLSLQAVLAGALVFWI